MGKRNIILASGSPRRKELLGYIYPEFSVYPSPFDEKSLDPAGLSPEELVRALSRHKAEAVYRLARKDGADPLVIGGDTVVVSPEGEVLGKPRDGEDAARMLRLLSGACHRVITGVSLFWREGAEDRAETFSVTTRVWFYPLTEGEIAGYIASGEPFDKAGGYGIQGKGGLLAEKIEGDYWTVFGLQAGRLQRDIALLGLL